MDGFVSYTRRFLSKLFNGFTTPYCRELAKIVAGAQVDFSGAQGKPTASLAAIMDVSTPEKLAYASSTINCKSGPIAHFPLPYEDGLHALKSEVIVSRQCATQVCDV